MHILGRRSCTAYTLVSIIFVVALNTMLLRSIQEAIQTEEPEKYFTHQKRMERNGNLKDLEITKGDFPLQRARFPSKKLLTQDQYFADSLLSIAVKKMKIHDLPKTLDVQRFPVQVKDSKREGRRGRKSDGITQQANKHDMQTNIPKRFFTKVADHNSKEQHQKASEHVKNKRIAPQVQSENQDLKIEEFELDAKARNFKEEKTVQQQTFHKYFDQGVNVDWWRLHVCLNKTTTNVKWHPLFPDIPMRSTHAQSLSDGEFIISSYVRRFYGLLFTNVSAMFDFKLGARDGIEMVLVDTGMTIYNFSMDFDIMKGRRIFYKQMSYDEIVEQDKKISQHDIFSCMVNQVKLEAKRFYYLEILQGGLEYGKMKIEWMYHNFTFHDIPTQNLFYLKRDTLPNRKFPSLLQRINTPISKFGKNRNEHKRLEFHKIPRLTNFQMDESNICDPVTLNPRKSIRLYDGKEYLDRFLVYPKEYFNFTGGWPHKHLLLDEFEAETISRSVVKDLQENLRRTVHLKHIVHVEKSLDAKFNLHNDWKNALYFVELDIVLDSDEKTVYRSSLHVRKNTQNGKICFIKEYSSWSHKAMINILTPVKNQVNWVKHLLRSLEHIITTTNDKNIRLILIDYNSTDADLHEILTTSFVPHKHVKVDTPLFNKVKAINIGLKHVTDDASIAFVLDLHLEIPLNIFDRIRKHTIQDFTGYCPTLLKFQCGEHEQYTNLEQSLWVDDGFGMMAMYKSDWTKVGGMNETLFGTKWGGEDWELTDRIVKHGLYLFHNRLPRFYHIYHSPQKTWDGTHG